jgi:putative ABC transport system permease protein
MGALQAFKMSLKSMLSNKGRTFLTMLGVIIGVATFITLVGLGEGTKKSISDSIESMGTNLINITITGRHSNRNVTYKQLTAFADQNSDEIEAIAPTISGNVTLKNGDMSWDTSLIGTSPEYETVRNVHVQSGRFITQMDVDYRQKVVLVGTAVISNIFSSGVNPLNQEIKIEGEKFTIIGILEQKAKGQNYSTDDKIIIPITVAQRLEKSAQIRNFSVQAKSSDLVDAAMAKITQFMTKTYNDDTAFRVQNQADMLSSVSTVTGTMTTFLGCIAGISLFVGGIGIMNIMLVSVTERTREIGIRKAIGARRKDILSQFLIESILISCTGGIVGILIGTSLVVIVKKFTSLAPAVTVSSILTSFIVSAVVGVFFGIYPASKASKLNPIEALRFE